MATPSIQRKTKSYLLSCVLTKEEIHEKGKELAHQLQVLKMLDADFDSFKNKYKKESSDAETKINDLSNAIDTEKELRQVECTEIWDYSAGEVSTVRKDTGEQISFRVMTADERQTTLLE